MTEKGHNTALRIMEVLKILLDSGADKKTLIEKIKSSGSIPGAATYEAYSKYFNTFEELGLNIEKTENGFKLKNALIGIDLTPEEQKLCEKLIAAIPKLNSRKKERAAKQFFSRLSKYINTDLDVLLKQAENIERSKAVDENIINTIKQIMEDEAEAVIKYRKSTGKEETLQCSIKKIIEIKGHYYAVCTSPSMPRSRRICSEAVIYAEYSPNKASDKEPDCSVVFEVYGRLSKSYKIKEWETLDSFGEGFMRIRNTSEDFETLFNRLLKYGENCKIIRPFSAAYEFLALTDDVLHNLEGSVC